MASRLKLQLLLACVAILAFSSLGCDSNTEYDSSLEEGEALDFEEVQENIEEINRGYTYEELKERLYEAVLIELKDTENQTIGAVAEREDVIQLVDTIFSYRWQESYPEENQDYFVIGPLNFYFNDGESIFGLAKENYIFIEGFYFLLDRDQKETLKKTFQEKVLHAPVNGT
ncbi:hypothetical protein F8154_01645 [Alkaliphilus pronyensis]|uniref:Uncharacterized protein n=1 Tax=Alkaliphilus pronyensis TaxID=1482732 RepID=A0A6I0FE98_9FIRM|nr:hypothetical protein [Alkaliphilus pronyensis]KAB3538622.1 hypothetical protein F8154_01645 [Alkaliphilus pronyensis]